MNQPPPTEKPPGKRIVSKGESLTDATRRWAMSISICLMVWAVLSPLFYEQFYAMAKRTGDFKEWLFWLALFLFPMLLIAVSTTRKVIVQAREQYLPSIPVNTADLPAPDSLVRASEEPRQEQEAVLLRAATEASERHEEQLVRASLGGTE